MNTRPDSKDALSVIHWLVAIPLPLTKSEYNGSPLAASGWQEQKLVHILFTDRDEKYQLLKPYCVEYGKNVIFSKTDNEILLPY